MPILREYYNENAHRYYPFVNTNEVPTGLILDFCLISTANLPDNATSEDTSVTYISQLTTDGTQLRVYLAATTADGDIDFGCIATTDVSTPIVAGGVLGRRTNIAYAANGYVFQGYIITGDLERLLPLMPASTSLDAITGRLYTNCIMHMTQWVAGIQVGDETLTGVVELVAGPGISLNVSGNTVTVSCTGATIPPDNAIIVDDDTLRNNLIAAYGQPITSINGVAITPSSDGRLFGGGWTIAVKPDEGLVVVADNTTHSISITNQFAQACCSSDQIQTLVDNIAQLNERIITVNNFLTQLETNVNIISTQLTRLT